MRRVCVGILAFLMVIVCAGSVCAQQENEMSVQALADLIRETWQELSREEIEALLLQYDTENEGTLENGVYTHEDGIRFALPENWTLLENVPGTTAVLRAEEDESGFAPTISVLVLGEERTDLTRKSGEDWDAYYAQHLKGYQRLLFDQFEYRTTTAYELGIIYGESEEEMRIQYQFYFLEGGRTYLITMTSLADEDAYFETLSAYDSFLAGFEPISAK